VGEVVTDIFSQTYARSYYIIAQRILITSRYLLELFVYIPSLIRSDAHLFIPDHSPGVMTFYYIYG
jgi:hypothetical protein